MKRTFSLFLMILSICASGQIRHEITVDLDSPAKAISPAMYGIFFEDINFGADGGLYAELVKNRSFEFPNHFTGWKPFGLVSIENTDFCFERNPHYVRITNDGRRLRAGLDNEGFRGMGIKKGEEYRFSAYARTSADSPMRIVVELISSDGYNHYYGVPVEIAGNEWHKVTATLKAPFTDSHASMRIFLDTRGTVDMDHISLFPADTWKGRENGMRKDLAQALYDLNPGVFRFPGGCIIEGNSLDTRYQWKNSIGPVENRPINENRWNHVFKHRAAPDYFQSYGIGFYEYFLLSEDIGAEPLPVISCGMSCQFESNELVPLDELDPYIQDALDLIEFANGDPSTVWGKVRAEMGHPEPFDMKYLAVGNEQWGEEYVKRLELFLKALREKHPEITVVGSSGPYPDGKDFDYLWPEMARLGVDLVDEHYYKDPDWFYANAARYDSYDRKGPKVFAGEYAGHDEDKDKVNNFNAALSEAAFMTGLERNADIVPLATYAPLFAHAEAWQWRPDLIWFDNLRVMKTPNYYVQKMYGHNAGTDVLSLTMDGKPVTGQEKLYATAASDSATDEIIIKIVNASDAAADVHISFEGMKKKQQIGNCRCTYLQSDDIFVENTFENETVSPKTKEVEASGKALDLTLEPYSFSIYRLSVE